MRNRERRCLDDIGMAHQCGIHLVRRDLEAAAIDELLDASRQVEVAGCIEVTEVAGPEPSIAKRLAIGFRVVHVLSNARSANDDLARFERGQRVAGVAVNDHVQSHRAPDGAWAADSRRERIACNEAGFGHGVRLDDRYAEQALETALNLDRKGGRAGPDQPQRARSDRSVALVFLEHGDVDRRTG